MRVALCLLAVLALLAGCGSGAGDLPRGQRPWQLALVAGSKGDPYYAALRCGAQDAAEAAGADLSFEAPDQLDASLQTPILSAVAAEQPDAILVAPADDRALYAPIRQAADSGSRVVLVDTWLARPGIAVSRVGSDDLAAGRQGATTLARLVGGHGKVLVVGPQAGVASADARRAGFEREVHARRGLRYLGARAVEGDAGEVAKEVREALERTPDLAGIFATTRTAAEGAARALRSAKRDGEVRLVGVDASRQQLDDLEDDSAQALIVLKPAEIGRLGVEQALAALEGHRPEPRIAVGFVVVTAGNAGDPRIARWLYSAQCKDG